MRGSTAGGTICRDFVPSHVLEHGWGNVLVAKRSLARAEGEKDTGAYTGQAWAEVGSVAQVGFLGWVLRHYRAYGHEMRRKSLSFFYTCAKTPRHLRHGGGHPYTIVPKVAPIFVQGQN